MANWRPFPGSSGQRHTLLRRRAQYVILAGMTTGRNKKTAENPWLRPSISGVLQVREGARHRVHVGVYTRLCGVQLNPLHRALERARASGCGRVKLGHYQGLALIGRCRPIPEMGAYTGRRAFPPVPGGRRTSTGALASRHRTPPQNSPLSPPPTTGAAPTERFSRRWTLPPPGPSDQGGSIASPR